MEGLGSLIAHLIGGYLTDRIGRRMTMMISFFGVPVLMMALYYSQSFVAIALICVVYGFFLDLYRPASSTLIADILPPQERIRGYALRYWAINLGASIGLTLAGFLATQNYILLFIGDAATTLVFGIIILLFVPETRPKAPVPPVNRRAVRARASPSPRMSAPPLSSSSCSRC